MSGMYSSVLFLHIDLYLLGVIEFFMELETKIIELWIVDAISYYTIRVMKKTHNYGTNEILMLKNKEREANWRKNIKK